MCLLKQHLNRPFEASVKSCTALQNFANISHEGASGTHFEVVNYFRMIRDGRQHFRPRECVAQSKTRDDVTYDIHPTALV